MITTRIRPEHIVAHEVIGLDVEVVESPNKYTKGIRGKVVDETQNTIVVETEKGEKRIQKRNNVFLFRFHGTPVRVKGDLIAFRPEDRIKKGLQMLKRWKR